LIIKVRLRSKWRLCWFQRCCNPIYRN